LARKAPEFALPDAGGRIVRSADLLALGPLVINFFRGRWCPYCVTELETWRDLYSAVRKRGALLIGISPQTVRQNDFTAVQHGLPFPVLTDAGCRLAAQFGLAYAVAPSQQQYYRSILVNIPLVNGDASWRLPLPATYILGKTARSCLPARMPISASAPNRGKCWMCSRRIHRFLSGTHLQPVNSFNRLAINRRAGSGSVSARAFSYEARASAILPTRRHRSARAE
jgi:peroxiredoxin